MFRMTIELSAWLIRYTLFYVLNVVFQYEVAYKDACRIMEAIKRAFQTVLYFAVTLVQ